MTSDDSPLPHTGLGLLTSIVARVIAPLPLAVLMAWLVAVGALAVPAKVTWRTFTQSDGTLITVRLCGDESMRYYVTTDGVPLVLAADGDFCYARTTGFGISSTGVVAHEAALRTATELSCLSTQASAESLRALAPRALARGSAAKRRSPRAITADGQTRRGLVIMVDFPDREFLSADSHGQWNAILNERGFALNGAAGSVADYFRDQSGGLFNMEFDLMGPVTASQSRYYYGANDRWDYDIDLKMGQLVVEACEAISSEVDFGDYDWDGDSIVDQVFILYAGGGEAVTGANSNLIWPHEYYVSAYEEYPGGHAINGYVIDTYACGCELDGLERPTNTSLSGLGIFCHEFAHCLGLPDFYSYSGTDMLGEWDLMSEGCYNADGWCPPEFTAYEKMYCGWLQPTALTQPDTIASLLPTSWGGTAYLVRNDAVDPGVDEYYLIENRQQTGWDAHAPGSGIIITHVDYDEQKWYYNTVNDQVGHPGVAIISASNGNSPTWSVAYPHNDNDSLTDNSSPSARIYHLSANGTMRMGKPITDMAVADGVASFVFMAGVQSSANEPSGIDPMASVEALLGLPATIYDAAGRQVATISAYHGLPAGLRPGMYVVKTHKGTMKIWN